MMSTRGLRGMGNSGRHCLLACASTPAISTLMLIKLEAQFATAVEDAMSGSGREDGLWLAVWDTWGGFIEH